MSHLGDRVAALVDEQLPADVRERLLSHVARCSQCRREVEAARMLKRRVSALGSPAPSDHLTRRLVAMSEPGEPMPADRSTTWGRRRGPTWGVGHVSAGAHQSRLLRATAVAVSLSAATLGFAFVVGNEGEGELAPVVPPVDRFVVEHAATSGDVPLTEPAVSAVTVGREGMLGSSAAGSSFGPWPGATPWVEGSGSQGPDAADPVSTPGVPGPR